MVRAKRRWRWLWPLYHHIAMHCTYPKSLYLHIGGIEYTYVSRARIRIYPHERNYIFSLLLWLAFLVDYASWSWVYLHAARVMQRESAGPYTCSQSLPVWLWLPVQSVSHNKHRNAVYKYIPIYIFTYTCCRLIHGRIINTNEEFCNRAAYSRT